MTSNQQSDSSEIKLFDGSVSCNLLNDLDNLVKERHISELLFKVRFKSKSRYPEVDTETSHNNIREYVEVEQAVLDEERTKILHWINCVHLCKIDCAEWWYKVYNFIPRILTVSLSLERLYRERPLSNGKSEKRTIQTIPRSLVYIYDKYESMKPEMTKIDQMHEELCKKHEKGFLSYYFED